MSAKVGFPFGSSNANDSVGLIGIGLLGSAIGERLLDSAYTVFGFDPVANLSAFAANGGAICSTGYDVASQCSRVVLSLPDSTVVRSVVDELRSVLSGRTLIDTTTGSPEDTIAIAEKVRAAGGEYLDAMVAGSSAMMREHAATVLVGGSSEAFKANKVIFDAIGSKIFHLGGNGSGAKMKLVVNLAIGLNRAVLGEALAFGESFGFDSHQILDVLINTPAHSDAMDIKGEKMAERDFAPQARLRQHLKDVRLILDSAKQNDAIVPLSTLHEQLLQSLVEAGRGEEDNSVVVEAFRRN
ncbi:MAG: NAD(P)-dependent oxidoreductase [Planctomycetales bacterium]|nr:NAD(P)-dependent oxidoreductase [Planctomycetales bacterium]